MPPSVRSARFEHETAQQEAARAALQRIDQIVHNLARDFFSR
ncbi:hypothetical protein SALB1_3019 [Salinisphaera sp. LB1]|nr:hypothetical protein SALB1_3019 [Salinisphaera sp. LB1]